MPVHIDKFSSFLSSRAAILSLAAGSEVAFWRWHGTAAKSTGAHRMPCQLRLGSPSKVTESVAVGCDPGVAI